MPDSNVLDGAIEPDGEGSEPAFLSGAVPIPTIAPNKTALVIVKRVEVRMVI